MIRTIDIDINAANPNLPLSPFQAYVTSPSALRIRNVPRRIGTWEITSVQFTVNYPDNTSRSAVCKLVAGVWVGTVVGSTSTGTSTNGFSVTASGVDENGYAVTGYILGKGDVAILATDGTITIGETTYYIHLLDAQPTTPKKGDLCLIDNAWKIYNGSAWVSFGGGVGDITHSEFSSVSTIADRYTLADIKGKVNEVLNILKGSALALLVWFCASASMPTFAALTPQTARLDSLHNDSLVVTNVSGGSDIDYGTVTGIVTSAAVTNLGAVAAATNAAKAYADGRFFVNDGEHELYALDVSCEDIDADYIDAQSIRGRIVSTLSCFNANGMEIGKGYFCYNDHTISLPNTSDGIIALTSDFTTNNAVLVSTITNVAGKAGGGTAQGINLHDAGLGCDWQLSVSNSVFTWTVKED